MGALLVSDAVPGFWPMAATQGFGEKPAPFEADDVREIALRSLRDWRERRFTAWRGRSGRRYVASVFAVGDEGALGFPDAVLIAVSPDRRVLAVRESGPFGVEAATRRWCEAVRHAGAAEIHVHLLADTPEARRQAVADLTPVSGASPAFA